MKTIKVNNFSKAKFLGIRCTAEKIRELMKQYIFDKNEKVCLDFEGIEGVTQGFIDELIGIFTREFGKDFIKSNICAKNYNEEIQIILNWVVDYSNKFYKEHKNEKVNS